MALNEDVQELFFRRADHSFLRCLFSPEFSGRMFSERVSQADGFTESCFNRT